MGKSVRSKKMRANRAQLRIRYAPRELAKLKETVAAVNAESKANIEGIQKAQEQEAVETTESKANAMAVEVDGEELENSETKSLFPNKSQRKKKMRSIKIKKLSKRGVRSTKRFNL
eukprot:CFRG4322T1